MAEHSFPAPNGVDTADHGQACGARVSLTRWCGQRAGHTTPCDRSWPPAKTAAGQAR